MIAMVVVIVIGQWMEEFPLLRTTSSRTTTIEIRDSGNGNQNDTTTTNSNANVQDDNDDDDDDDDKNNNNLATIIITTTTNRTTIPNKITQEKINPSFIDGIVSNLQDKEEKVPAIYVYPDPLTFLDQSSMTDPFVNRPYQRTYFELESELLNILKRRGRIVTDPNRANLFWIPHTLILHWIYPSKKKEKILWYFHNQFSPLLNYIYHHEPYFNMTKGKDHVFVYVMDNGPRCEVGYKSEHFVNRPLFQKVIWNARNIGYWGKRHWHRTVSPRNPTIVDCFNEQQDIMVPQYHTWDMSTSYFTPTASFASIVQEESIDEGERKARQQQQQQGTSGQQVSLEEVVQRCTMATSKYDRSDPVHEDGTEDPSSSTCHVWYEYLYQRAWNATKPFYFRGNVDLEGKVCSRGIRPWIKEYCSHPDVGRKNCHFFPETGSNTEMGEEDGISNNRNNNNTNNQEEEITMTNAVFALSPAGWACWSSRLYDAYYQMVIPILLADDMVLPYEKYLKYDDLLVRVTTGNPTNLPLPNNPKIHSLAQLAKDWIETCRTPTLYTECIQHSISYKMGQIILHRKWFGWQHPTQQENTITLIEQELMS